jgi:hypothetical protein
MWEVSTDLFGLALPGPDGKIVTDPAERRDLVQRRSTPWSVAWHALECLDYDLTGELAPWAPPSPFTGKPHWQLTTLPRAWTRSEIVGYIEYCRQRARDVLADMTEGEGGDTPASGPQVQRRTSRADHHSRRRAHDRARLPDPPVRY